MAVLARAATDCDGGDHVPLYIAHAPGNYNDTNHNYTSNNCNNDQNTKIILAFITGILAVTMASWVQDLFHDPCQFNAGQAGGAKINSFEKARV